MTIEIALLDKFHKDSETSFDDHSKELISLHYSEKFKEFARQIELHGFVCLPGNPNWYISIYTKDKKLQAFYAQGAWRVISSNLLLQIILPNINLDW